MSKNNGGPAFPTTKESHLMICSEGMTLRDYFAAKAMHAIIGICPKTLPNSDLARDSYNVADAMLAERDKDNG
jgi:hypothetical protein